MSAPIHPAWSERIKSALPFLLMSALAIVGGGVLAAAMAHAPSRKLLWTVAYLVLVVGATQAALGMGQALLARRTAAAPTRVAEWVLFNLGSAGVIGGTLYASRPVLWLGTLLFAASLGVFLVATRGVRGGWSVLAYRILLVCLGASAVVGLVLAMVRARP